MNIAQDYINAFNIAKQVRKARKSGEAVRVEAVKRVPAVRMGYWYATMEGCLLCGNLNTAVKAIFDELDEADKHALTFSPNDEG